MLELLFRYTDRFRIKGLLQHSILLEKEILRLSHLGNSICDEYARTFDTDLPETAYADFNSYFHDLISFCIPVKIRLPILHGFFTGDPIDLSGLEVISPDEAFKKIRKRPEPPRDIAINVLFDLKSSLRTPEEVFANSQSDCHFFELNQEIQQDVVAFMETILEFRKAKFPGGAVSFVIPVEDIHDHTILEHDLNQQQDFYGPRDAMTKRVTQSSFSVFIEWLE